MPWSERFRSTGKILIPAFGCLLFSACATGPMAEPGIAVGEPVAALGQNVFSETDLTDYPVYPADVLSIRVFREPDLSLDEVTIANDGLISVPLVGSVLASGRTVREIETLIEQELGTHYLRNPDVTVNVLRYESHVVTVEGAVETPGLYPFQPGTRLSGGIAMAEGMERAADPGQVVVFRRTPEGMQIAKFDYRAVRAGTMLDPVLRPGDRVIVGTDGLSQFWLDLLRSLPAFALFTNI